MISERAFNIFSYAVLAFMAIAFVLVAFGLVPQAWYWHLFVAILVIYLLRMALRLLIARQKRLDKEAAPKTDTPPAS